MCLHPRPINDILEQTAEVARAAFPKGNVYMIMRDELGTFYHDEGFADLFASRGQPGASPWRLALITMMQFAENLTDRQTAEAVRSRIDWKYALSLELTDPGFHFSVLSDFRARMVEHEALEQLLNAMLERFKTRGLLKVSGRKRTDSTHILAAVRMLNHLEQVGEMLRYTLNVLAEQEPAWLKAWVPTEWFERYQDRFENYRLPTDTDERELLARTIGEDGFQLLNTVYATLSSAGLWELQVVQDLQTMWVQQFYLENELVQWRESGNLPPSKQEIISPYDTDACYSHKRQTTWTGYKVQLTETRDADHPRLITHVETTPSTLQDIEVVNQIQTDLVKNDWSPREHLVDMGYISSDVLVTSQYLGIDLVGPVRLDSSWQACTQGAFDLTCFKINWEAKTVTCPMGKVNDYWHEGLSKFGKPNVNVGFKTSDCRACPHASRCTRNTGNLARTLTFPRQAECLALQATRERQKTEAFKTLYRARAGVEGVISQAAFTLRMRRTRYRGQPKTHLQNVAIAAAINLPRPVHCLMLYPKAKTRLSPFAALAA